MPKHITRLIALIAVFGVVAWLARGWLTADTFYEFGHYRGDSVVKVAALEPVYQTAGYCESCHAERLAEWSGQAHKSVACEVCHGAAKGHPGDARMSIPSNSARLCSLCHEAMAGRPSTQPQIDVAAHSAGRQCITCHNPHAPRIATQASRVAGDAAAGRKRAEDCASCHGAEGISGNDTWPSLAGMSPVYLARILTAYKSGAQTDVMMTPIARELSDADIQNLAAHYGSLACGPGDKPAAAGNASAGAILAKNCAACHGETGVTANPAWPSIAAQKPGYLVNALKAFRAGLRKDPMMAGVTRGLSDADIADLAAFYAQQDCTPPREQQARRKP